MRALIGALLAGLIFSTAYAQAIPEALSAEKFSTDKIHELESLPFGISVVHGPNPVLATWDARQQPPCKWSYETRVTSLFGNVTVTEFGMFAWSDNRWLFKNVTDTPFTQQDFEKWYGCPGGVLVSGQSFSDSTNWSVACVAAQGKSRWYFIGVNEAGVRVKGEATVELAGQYEPFKE